MEVQKHIRKYGLESLKGDPLNISINLYDNGLVVLNYNQIKSSKHNPIVKECRALILNSKDDYSVVSRSFDRFFNYRECPETDNYNICDGKVLEKIDGSLISVYHHDGQWNAATRKMAYAEGLTAFGNTYRQVFDKAFDIDSLRGFDENLVLVFEVVSPENRNVTPYSKYDTYILTVRNRKTGFELKTDDIIQISKEINVKTPNIYPLNTYDEVIHATTKLSPLEEGYIVLWENNNEKHRIKIKNIRYLAIANMREDGILSEKRMVTLISSGGVEEYFIYFQEDRQFFQPYIDAFQKLIDHVDLLWFKYKDIPNENQKEFALAVKDSPVASILFNMRKGITKENAMSKANENSMLRMVLSYKEI